MNPAFSTAQPLLIQSFGRDGVRELAGEEQEGVLNRKEGEAEEGDLVTRRGEGRLTKTSLN